jgi:hypothetical protein
MAACCPGFRRDRPGVADGGGCVNMAGGRADDLEASTARLRGDRDRRAGPGDRRLTTLVQASARRPEALLLTWTTLLPGSACGTAANFFLLSTFQLMSILGLNQKCQISYELSTEQ